MILNAARALLAHSILPRFLRAGSSTAGFATGSNQPASEPRGDYSIVMKKAVKVHQTQAQAPVPAEVGNVTGVQASYLRRPVSAQNIAKHVHFSSWSACHEALVMFRQHCTSRALLLSAHRQITVENSEMA